MALVNLPGVLFWPPMMGAAANPSYGTMLLDAAGEKAGAVIEVPKAGNIRKIHFRTGTVTTGETVDVRVETVDGSGDPSGTLWAANTNVSQLILATDDTVWFSPTLTADAVVVAGDKIGVVIALPTPINVGNMNIVRIGDVETMTQLAYTDLFTASWLKSAIGKPCVALEYSDGTFSDTIGCYPISTLSTRTFNSGSTPDERGIKFQVPWKCRVKGAWYHGASPTTGGTLRLKLYDSGGTLLVQTPSVDHDLLRTLTAGRCPLNFTATQELSINTVYRLTLLPETATNVTLNEFTVNAAAIMDAFAGGQNVHLTTRTDAGAFTDTVTERTMMGLIVDQLDDGAGGGGGIGALVGGSLAGR